MNSDPLTTQRDVGPAVVTELTAAGFADPGEIGRGGFGIVFRCTQVKLDRVVAVKVLTARLLEDRERFLREQRAMARLTGHPNIVGVLQVGETASGYPYLVMQYHSQGSLQARIKRLGPLPIGEVLRIGVKLAGALESAHRLGILHRDVKPANILLTDYGEPALTDFGIAHIAGGFETAAGTFTGSPAFTAPEILSRRPAQPRPPMCMGWAPPFSPRSRGTQLSNAIAMRMWWRSFCESPPSRCRICVTAASRTTCRRVIAGDVACTRGPTVGDRPGRSASAGAGRSRILRRRDGVA